MKCPFAAEHYWAANLIFGIALDAVRGRYARIGDPGTFSKTLAENQDSTPRLTETTLKEDVWIDSGFE